MDPQVYDKVHYRRSRKVGDSWNRSCQEALISGTDGLPSDSDGNWTVSLAILRPDGWEYLRDVEQQSGTNKSDKTWHYRQDCNG